MDAFGRNGFRREFEMRLPVANWLLSRGLIPIVEVASLRNCDMVGVEFDPYNHQLVRMVAVELKLEDAAETKRQCDRHVGRVTETWAAFPVAKAMREAAPHSRFEADGIGILAVSETKCTPISSAIIFDGAVLRRWQNAMWRRRREYLWRMKHKDMIRFTDEKAGMQA